MGGVGLGERSGWEAGGGLLVLALVNVIRCLSGVCVCGGGVPLIKPCWPLRGLRLLPLRTCVVVPVAPFSMPELGIGVPAALLPAACWNSFPPHQLQGLPEGLKAPREGGREGLLSAPVPPMAGLQQGPREAEPQPPCLPSVPLLVLALLPQLAQSIMR